MPFLSMHPPNVTNQQVDAFFFGRNQKITLIILRYSHSHSVKMLDELVVENFPKSPWGIFSKSLMREGYLMLIK